MRFLVLVENFETITGEPEIRRVREMVKEKAAELRQSEKVAEAGVFADRRGAFFLVEAESGAELARLFFPMHDWAHFDVRPLYSFEELQDLFAEEG